MGCHQTALPSFALARMKLPSPASRPMQSTTRSRRPSCRPTRSVKAADAARVATEEKLRSIEQQSTKSGEMSVAEREEWQKARDREIASDPGPVDGIPAQ